MAKTSPTSATGLLAAELWGIGDLALALPFLRTAADHTAVALLAKPHAAPLLQRFAPKVELIPLEVPWTAFRGKYRLHRWPWRRLAQTLDKLQTRHFAHAVSARSDPREHLLLRLARPDCLTGFPRAGSRMLLHRALPQPSRSHRAGYWHALAASLGWAIPTATPQATTGRNIVIHTGAGQPVRRWPEDRYDEIAGRLRVAGWNVTLLDDTLTDLNALLDTLAQADRFIGNDSGPGHLAALLGVPTFTLFGPQLPEHFAPVHPQAAWLAGSPCPYKPCRDYCRFAQPDCLLDIRVENVWFRLTDWLRA